MRHWILVGVVTLQALALIALGSPLEAKAASSSATHSTSTMTFKGKASVYYRNSGPYFVVNFSCSGGTLSGNWTYAVYEGGAKQSYSGTLSSSGCSLSGPPWSSGTSMDGVQLSHVSPPLTATLNLDLYNIAGTKTYVSDTNGTGPPPCPDLATPTDPNPACIVIQSHGLSTLAGSDFDSQMTLPSYGTPYGTLTLSA